MINDHDLTRYSRQIIIPGFEEEGQEEILSKNITTIVIAHRLSTVINSNMVLVLDKGEIVERGNHNQLLKLDGLYASMWRQQERNLILEK